MSAEEIITALDALPDDERRKVYLELEQKRRDDPAARLPLSSTATPSTARALAESPLVGLWKNRDDLGDSPSTARRLREQAQHRWG